MRKTGAALAAIALFAACAPQALAHHSAAMFDFTKSVQVKGVVKEFTAMNPHLRLMLVVTDAKGNHDIGFEGHSLNNMYRGGWRPGKVKIGDQITINIAPERDGSEGGYVTSIVTATGEKIGM